MKQFFTKIKEGIEKVIPMTLGSFLLFAVTVYVFYVVGRSILINYNSNKDIDKQAMVVYDMEGEVADLKNQINYYQTASYKEKEARAKLGYKAPGENVISLPLDDAEDAVSDQSPGEVHIKTPNYRLWWEYFFGA